MVNAADRTVTVACVLTWCGGGAGVALVAERVFWTQFRPFKLNPLQPHAASPSRSGDAGESSYHAVSVADLHRSRISTVASSQPTIEPILPSDRLCV